MAGVFQSTPALVQDFSTLAYLSGLRYFLWPA